MNYYSQLDPAYKNLIIPKSSTLTMGGYGCFICSIATLSQKNPKDMLKFLSCFTNGGLLIPGNMAEQVGLFYVGATTKAPQGWCIGRTDKYAPSVPTHFLCVNIDTNQMIDPLKCDSVTKQSKVEPLTYKINQYRTFTGLLLNTVPPAPVYEQPAPPPIPAWAAGVAARANAAGIKTPLTDSFGDMPIYQALLLIEKYLGISMH